MVTSPVFITETDAEHLLNFLFFLSWVPLFTSICFYDVNSAAQQIFINVHEHWAERQSIIYIDMLVVTI